MLIVFSGYCYSYFFVQLHSLCSTSGYKWGILVIVDMNIKVLYSNKTARHSTFLFDVQHSLQAHCDDLLFTLHLSLLSRHNPSRSCDMKEIKVIPVGVNSACTSETQRVSSKKCK